MAGRRKTKKDGSAYPSSTGKVRKVRADQTIWRKKLQQSRLKFDDPQKQTYLTELASHGLKGRAAAAAGVCSQTVNDHCNNDDDFSEAVDEAIDTYRDGVVEEVSRRGKVGWDEAVWQKGMQALMPVTDDDGNVLYTGEGESRRPVMRPASVRKFSDPLLILEAKRVDPAYREKQTIDLNPEGGGVLVAPARISPEEWVAREMEKNKSRRPPEGVTPKDD